MTDQPDLIARLAEIDARAGRPPMPDPTKIMGEGPEPPPYVVREREPGEVPEPDWMDPEVDIDVLPDEGSPLIPRQTHEVAPGPTNWPPPAKLPKPDLAVAVVGSERVASLKGWETLLTEEEARDIRRVVVRAMRRVLREQESPRRRSPGAAPVSAERPGAVPAKVAPSTPTPRKRGRPKKVQQTLDGGTR